MATTEHLMAQHGVAWFGFDEANGNVYDKLGNNYVGTVTGATRVDGWNGEGHSMSFSGSSQYVVTNYTPSTLNEFTVKLKFKCPVNGGGYLLTVGRQLDSNVSNINGYGVTVDKTTGNIRVLYWFNSTSATVTFHVKDYNYKDNKWHEIELTQKDNTINLYIDGISFGVYQSISNIITPKNPFRLGYLNVSNYQEWYLGQLDDLQIYNKALSPSDFIQKRLAVKSESNKNLVLLSTSTRIKEIPNTEEDTLFAQGGVIHEIDSAIDRPSIDLTRDSVEYEVVGNDKSNLGKGVMFTIPINNNFKTAFIEDNY